MLNKEKYLDLLSQKKAAQSDFTDSSISLITDTDILLEFESAHEQMIGMIPNEPFYSICLDVYRNNTTGTLFRYCNIHYNRFGAAILVIINGYILLNRQYRPFIGSEVYEVPRGFADPEDPDNRRTAIRELLEETGIDIKSTDYTFTLKKLGDIYPDSGLSNNKVTLFLADITMEECPNLNVMDKNEAIVGHTLVSEEEFQSLIQSNKINDSFTLCAYLMYLCTKE